LKRSRLKPGKPLQRKKGLERKTRLKPVSEKMKANRKGDAKQRDIVFERAGNQCEARDYTPLHGRFVDRSGPLERAHIFSRRFPSIRQDPLNALCLCKGMHEYFTHHGGEFFAWIEKKWPGRIARLREMDRDYKRCNTPRKADGETRDT